MEESKHVCKFCSKSFPCGRSLGGHMRSHMINDISAQTDGTILTKKKLPSLPNLTSTTTATNNNNNNKKNSSTRANNSNTSTETSGYGLRENPKKTWKLDHSISAEGALTLADRSCKECDKVFPTWKALFCHMKSHSSSAAAEKERLSNNNNSLEEQQDSWASGNNQKSVLDSQSDNETAAPSRGKRSKRRTRYMMATANSSSLSFAAAANNNNNHNNNNASSSLSEIEQEQEEVAMCLMMLSRDVGQWGGLNSFAESSDNNSVFLEKNRQSSKAEGKKAYVCEDNETAKVKAFDQKKLESVKMEVEDFKIPGKPPVKNNDRARKSHPNEQSGDEIENLIIKETGIDQECNSSKRKFREAFDTAELRPTDSLKKPANKKLDSEACRNSDRGSKFECATCNKVFHSYQALGGHRASHKKIKGCFASKIESSENSIETEHFPDPTADESKVISIKSMDNEVPSNRNLALEEECDNDNKQEAATSCGAKKRKGHECPVCLKVFPSGQALGGHKRSHLVAGSSNEVKTEQIAIPIPEVPIPAIRNFLDLNLPAPVEEESNGIAGFNTWWIGGSNHKQEALVGLISN